MEQALARFQISVLVDRILRNESSTRTIGQNESEPLADYVAVDLYRLSFRWRIPFRRKELVEGLDVVVEIVNGQKIVVYLLPPKASVCIEDNHFTISSAILRSRRQKTE